MTHSSNYLCLNGLPPPSLSLSFSLCVDEWESNRDGDPSLLLLSFIHFHNTLGGPIATVNLLLQLTLSGSSTAEGRTLKKKRHVTVKQHIRQGGKQSGFSTTDSGLVFYCERLRACKMWSSMVCCWERDAHHIFPAVTTTGMRFWVEKVLFRSGQGQENPSWTASLSISCKTTLLSHTAATVHHWLSGRGWFWAQVTFYFAAFCSLLSCTVAQYKQL